MSKSKWIRMENAALDEWNGAIVLRGTIVNEDLGKLLVEEYQREAYAQSSLSDMHNALRNGERLPDAELSMRTEAFEQIDANTVILKDRVFIVDGQQRRNAHLYVHEACQETPLRFGAIVHLGRDIAWERDRFEVLNLRRNRVSTNVLLRNRRDSNRSVATIFGLTTNERNFVLHNRVTWDQNARRQHLVSAFQLAKIAGFLHSHLARSRKSKMEELVEALDCVVDTFGPQAFRANVRTFYEVIDKCWGIEDVTVKEGATHMRANFQVALATVFSNHTDFWTKGDKQLQVPKEIVKRLGKMNLYESYVQHLISESSKKDELFSLICDKLNYRRQTKLTPRHQNVALPSMMDIGDESEALLDAAE